MKVSLVGTNVELGPVREALGAECDDALLSPEPIAAAYARISRSPKTVADLRSEARENVERARKSNVKIVFEMGHASIAEHAVFNFDVEGVSRLALEQLEATRLASYTERSQRYVKIGRDFFMPPEIQEDASASAEFETVVSAMFDAYGTLLNGLGDEQGASAKEDARYVLPLCTAGQVGVTINARSLATTARRLKASPLAEVRDLGRALEEEGLRVAPSLIRHTTPGPLDVVEESAGPALALARRVKTAAAASARLVSVSPDCPQRVLDCVMSGELECLAGAYGVAERRPRDDDDGGAGRELRPADGATRPRQVVKWFSAATEHDRAPRAFELVDLVFEIVCSASCFAQLKRHRMATIIAASYDPALPLVVPPSVSKAGLDRKLLAALCGAAALYNRLLEAGNPARAYLLSNAHCRRVLLKLNLRELYHFSRLRMDLHAQWEIRGLARRMCDQARDALGECAMFLGGKDWFKGLRE